MLQHLTDESYVERTLLRGTAGAAVGVRLQCCDIAGAVSYLTHNGPVWRALPADFPPAGTVYWWADKWQTDGSTERMHDDLRERVRLAAGRQPRPTVAIIDSQSVKGSEMIAATRRGYDAGKKINGTKRHLAVDAPGLLLTILVTAASVQDRDAARPLLFNLRRAFPTVKLTWADGGLRGEAGHLGQDLAAPEAGNRQTAR